MLDQHASLCDSFRWQVPANFNIGQECCHRWTSSSADARRIALFSENAMGERSVWTYERLGATANQLSNGLLKMGVKRGDRVALVMSQRAEAIIAHIAIYSIGAVVLPISTQLPPKAMEYRLRDAEARVALMDAQGANNLLPILQRCHKLTQLIGIDVADERVLPWRSLLIRQSDVFKPVLTAASDPALLLYTAGASGPARGVLLPHSAVMGNLVTETLWCAVSHFCAFASAADARWRAATVGGRTPSRGAAAVRRRAFGSAPRAQPRRPQLPRGRSPYSMR